MNDQELFLREHAEWKKRQRREEETPASRARKLLQIQGHDGRRMKIATKAGAK